MEDPVGLQLACISSKSTINYGATSTIIFGDKHIEEYFNVANINYYDVILGTPFLQRLGIALDFASPGTIRMGTYTVPRNLPSAPADEKLAAAAQSQPRPKPPE